MIITLISTSSNTLESSSALGYKPAPVMARSKELKVMITKLKKVIPVYTAKAAKLETGRAKVLALKTVKSLTKKLQDKEKELVKELAKEQKKKAAIKK